jgi:hypothetical protein
MNPKQALLLRQKQIIQQLPSLSEVIRGSLIERRLRCGKPNCHCAKGEGHRTWYLTVSFARGRTEQVTVPEELLPCVKEWIKNYDRWWITLEEVSAINRELLRKRWLDSKRSSKTQR